MVKVNNNTWVMPSHLDASTAPTIFKKYTKQILSDNQWRLDFSKCTKIDSAGLATIIGCIKHANNAKIGLKILNLSDDALSLAKAHGVKEIIYKYISKAN